MKHKKTGMLQIPKARKLSELTNYSISLDNVNSWSRKKNLIGINLDSKMRYFYIGKIIKNPQLMSLKALVLKGDCLEIFHRTQVTK